MAATSYQQNPGGGPSPVGRNANFRWLIKEELTAEALASLSNACMFSALIKLYQGEGMDQGFKGDFIDIKLRNQLVAGRGRNLNNNPVIAKLVQRWARLEAKEPFYVYIDDLDREDITINSSEADRMDFYRYIGTALATKIDLAMAMEMACITGHVIGSTSQLISSTIFDRARAQLDMVPLPDMQDVFAVVHPFDISNIRTSLVGPVVQNSATGSGTTRLPGDPMALTPLSTQKGFKGYMYDIPFFTSKHIPLYEPGTWTTRKNGNNIIRPKVKGDNQTGNVLVTDGWSAGDKLKAGMVFTIEGVEQVNLVSKQSFREMSFTLTQDVTVGAAADETTEVKLPVSPEINAGMMSYGRNPTASELATDPTSTGTAVTTDAYNNVNASPADDADITIFGESNGQYRQAFLFDKSAMCRKDIPLARLSSDTQTDKVWTLDNKETRRIGFNMRYLEDFDIKNPKLEMRVDTWQAFSLIEPWNAIRIIGKNEMPLIADLT